MRIHVSVKIIMTLLVYCAALFGLILFQFGNFQYNNSEGNLFTIDILNDNNGKILEFSAKSGLFDVVIDRKKPLKLVTSDSVISCELEKVDTYPGSFRLVTNNGIVLTIETNNQSGKILVENTGPQTGETYIFLPVKWNLLNEKTNSGQAEMTLAKGQTEYTLTLPGTDILMFGEESLRLRPGQSISLTKTVEIKPAVTTPNTTKPTPKLTYVQETDAKSILEAFESKANTALVTSRLSAGGWTTADGSVIFTNESIKAFYNAMQNNGRMTEASRLLKAMDYGTNGSLYSGIFSGYYLKYIDAVVSSDNSVAAALEAQNLQKILELGSDAGELEDLLIRKPSLISKLDVFLSSLDTAGFETSAIVRYWVLRMLVSSDPSSLAQSAEASLCALASDTQGGLTINENGVSNPSLSLMAASAFRRTGILSSPLARSLASALSSSSDASGFISSGNSTINPETLLNRLGLLKKAPVFVTVKNPSGQDSWFLTANNPSVKYLSAHEIEFVYSATEGFPSYKLMYNMTPVVLNFYGANWPSDPSFDLYYAGYCVYNANVTIHKLEHLTADVKVYLQF